MSDPAQSSPSPSDAEPGPFARFAAEWRGRVEAALEAAVPAAAAAPTTLHQAMRHSVFAGGKRLRPLLALAGCRAVGGDPAVALRAAAGLECLHTYSLIHDDLPSMDDDDLRRGRPTCHVVFGEAMAILAGDALQALAFELAADAGPGAVLALARASGSVGMVGGQVADLEAERAGGADATLDRVREIHERKTAALIRASLEVGAHASGAASDEALARLGEYGGCLGLAFQIADDVLDLTGTAAQLGKQPGQDLAAGKLTYPAVLGLDASRAELERQSASAAALAGAVAKAAGRPAADAELLGDAANALARRTQ
ncbi:MAG: polyprenyl synthetase family protein [Planctomycetota bacterium]